ncbi:hypothetical protein BOW53_14690 [Solemya pervernicosa gill symbiont]|uniref:Nucleotide-diphospho-sugar transferase domain-containing protein n=3 Tax=Gammaproteobacteria incertae sedis TaxID=118884 RepID=A0A1T2L0V5_9GAMM|nr:hypothetical protein [Candidatus Reidiella endopervernicosa]OOZ38694.1 hypothetical protein BOW53_14690 [Solemya pervernicosa gill symbiont]QKQ25212.1 hypothetical protein HUE57_02075 [Candidatus Reidiella endopervernicosa]
MGDELFDAVPAHLLKKTEEQRVIATDLARLSVLQAALERGYETAIWLDADFLIFKPAEFKLPDQGYAVGREVWVQHDKSRKLKVYKKVHNAFLMFRKENSFLDFYRETAERLLVQNSGPMPPQFIGPKLLTALHNVAVLPVMESAGMLSPLVIKDVLKGGGDALSRFVVNSDQPITAANLCSSCCRSGEVSSQEMEHLIERLLKEPGFILNARGL